MIDRLALVLAGWFGCGKIPAARGTWAALAALFIAWESIEYSGLHPWHFGLLAVLMLPVAVWSAGRAAHVLGKKDPSFVVIDEVVGQWITVAGVSVWNWKSALAAFFLFRLFDIWKPIPVRQLERLAGGAGIVADDVMAGVYGALVLWAGGCFNLY